MPLVSLVIAFVPAVLFVAIGGWWRRRLDRSTSVILGVAVVWGAFVATSFTLLTGEYVEAALPLHFGPEPSGLGSVLLTPLLEEALKTLFLVMMLFQARLDTAMEGLLLGVAVGLGFAATENFLSFAAALRSAGGSEWLASIAYRTGVTGMMHATAAGVAGALLGHLAARAEFERWIVGPLLGFVGAALVHMGFNGGVQSATTLFPDAARIAAAAVGALILGVGGGVARAAVASEHTTFARTLERAAARGRIPAREASPEDDPLRRRFALLALRESAHPARSGSKRALELARLERLLAERAERAPSSG